MNSSRWSYIGVGTSVLLAFIGALTHSALALGVGAGFTFYNWHVAEAARRVEDEVLAEFIRTSLKDNTGE